MSRSVVRRYNLVMSGSISLFLIAAWNSIFFSGRQSTSDRLPESTSLRIIVSGKRPTPPPRPTISINVRTLLHVLSDRH